jgi:hypothetical protein
VADDKEKQWLFDLWRFSRQPGWANLVVGESRVCRKAMFHDGPSQTPVFPPHESRQ